MQTAAFGITGLETAFATLYTAFVKTRILTLSQLIDLMSTNPAKLFGLKQAGRLEVGMPADLAIIDLKHDYEIKANQMFSKGHNSPFIGWHVSGNVLMTLVDGQVVYGKDQQA